jgi:hypothetical protein
MSTTQFSKCLTKPRSCQCRNSKMPRAFQLQQFGDALRDPWDLLSSICPGFPIVWQRRNGKCELIDQSNYSDASSLHRQMGGKALWPWMGPDSIYGRAMKQFGLKRASNLQKGWNTWLGIAKWRLQLSGIHKVSTWLTRFQKARNLLQTIIATESDKHFWRVTQLGVAQVSSFMRTMRDLTRLKKLSNFARKSASKWHRYLSNMASFKKFNIF